MGGAGDALGARRRDVIDQFLREAAVICVAGALLGLLFGVLLAYAIAMFAGWQVAWAPLPIATRRLSRPFVVTRVPIHCVSFQW